MVDGCEVCLNQKRQNLFCAVIVFLMDQRIEFGRKDTRGDRHMFKAVCSDCGSQKFRFVPLKEKRFARNCFGHDDVKVSGISKITDKLNVKLDTILKLLGQNIHRRKSDAQTESKSYFTRSTSVETARQRKHGRRKIRIKQKVIATAVIFR